MSETKRPAAFPWVNTLIVVAVLSLAAASFYLFLDARQLLKTDLRGQRLAILPVVGTVAPSEQWQRWGIPSLVTETLSLAPTLETLDTDAFRRNLVLRSLDGTDENQRLGMRRLAIAMGAKVLVEPEIVQQDAKLALRLRLYDATGAVVEESNIKASSADALAWAQVLVNALYASGTDGQRPRALSALFGEDPAMVRLYAEGVDLWLRSEGTDNQRAQSARPYFEIVLRNHPQNLRARWRLMVLEREIGDRAKTAEMARELVEKASLQGDSEVNLQALRMQGLLAAIEGNLTAADHFTTLAYQAALSRKKKTCQLEVLSDQIKLALGAGLKYRDRAEELLVEAIESQRAAGDRLGESDSLLNLGLLYLQEGDLENAARLLGDAVKLMQDLGDEWGAQRSSVTLAEVLWRRGEGDAAIALWKSSLAYHQAQRDEPRILVISSSLGEALISKRAWAEAEAIFQNLRELAKAQGDTFTQAQAALAQAWLCLRRGYHRQAQEPLAFAVEYRAQISDRGRLQRTLAWKAYEEGRFVDAYRLWSELRGQKDWNAEDEEFLKAFVDAMSLGRRQKLPGESSSSGPIPAF